MYKKNIPISHTENMLNELCGTILVIEVNCYFCTILRLLFK